jgi:hypothetical protein
MLSLILATLLTQTPTCQAPPPKRLFGLGSPGTVYSPCMSWVRYPWEGPTQVISNNLVCNSCFGLGDFDPQEPAADQLEFGGIPPGVSIQVCSSNMIGFVHANRFPSQGGQSGYSMSIDYQHPCIIIPPPMTIGNWRVDLLPPHRDIGLPPSSIELRVRLLY